MTLSKWLRVVFEYVQFWWATRGKRRDDNSRHVKPDGHPAQQLRASFECLSRPVDFSTTVPGDVALTLAEFANLAYIEDDAEQDRLAKQLGANKAVPISSEHSEALIASGPDAIVVAFRGTSEPADFIADIDFFSHAIVGGTMHRGFWQSVQNVYAAVVAEIERCGGNSKPIWITGHSLGGAMAMVFAERLQSENRIDATGIVTFGQPLVMDERLCRLMLKRFPANYVRFVNNRDAVTLLVPNRLHAGARVHLLGDDFDFFEPGLRVCGRDGDDGNGSTLMPQDPDQQLLPMSDERFGELKNKIAQRFGVPSEDPERRRDRRRRPRRMAMPGVVAAAPAPSKARELFDAFFGDHSCEKYIESIRRIGATNFRRNS